MSQADNLAALGSNVNSSGVLQPASGGTGTTSNAAAPFALKGANSDITSLSGLTTALSVAQGGTGATSNAAAPFALKGANSDITSLSGLTTALSVAQGGTGTTTSTGTGATVRATSPSLTTPTIASGSILNASGRNMINQTGGILQVVSVFDNTQYIFNSGSANQTTYYDIAGLTASITPSSTSSRILLLATCYGGQPSGSYNIFLRFYRNATAIGIGNPTNYNAGATGVYRSNDQSAMGSMGMSFIDSPATTSAITYSIKICNSGGGVSPSYINRPQGNNTGWEQTAGSNFIIMEIAG